MKRYREYRACTLHEIAILRKQKIVRKASKI